MKKELPKLQFFSETILEKLACQVDNVSALLIAERVSYQKAFQMLHDGKRDLADIYYYAQAQLSAASAGITSLKKKGRFPDSQIEGPSIISLASQRSITSLRSALRDYPRGELSKKALRRARRLMLDCLNSDIAALSQETADLCRQAKVLPEQEQTGEDWRDLAQEMTIKKVPTRDDDLG